MSRTADKAAAMPTAKGAPQQARGRRTRQKIRDSLVGLLADKDYADISIAEICERAGIAVGGFYFHFERKDDLIAEVMREHSDAFWATMAAALNYRDSYSSLFHASSAYVRAFHDSPGLVRCFNQLAMVDTAYVRHWESAASAWTERLIRLLHECEGPGLAPISDLTAYGLLSFVDALLYALYIEVDAVLAASAGPPEQVIEEIAVLWNRGLTGHSPPPGRLAFAATLPPAA
jgi:AcrR family transcriptional regulator